MDNVLVTRAEMKFVLVPMLFIALSSVVAGQDGDLQSTKKAFKGRFYEIIRECNVTEKRAIRKWAKTYLQNNMPSECMLEPKGRRGRYDDPRDDMLAKLRDLIEGCPDVECPLRKLLEQVTQYITDACTRPAFRVYILRL